MSEYGDRRIVQTGQYRFRLKKQWFRDPLVVLQLQERQDKNEGYTVDRWIKQWIAWRDVQVEDLTTMSLQSLISPKEGNEFPICFKPKRNLFRWCLVLNICDGDYQTSTWRPARLQDLMIKDGKIQGGLGLFRRVD